MDASEITSTGFWQFLHCLMVTGAMKCLTRHILGGRNPLGTAIVIGSGN